MFSVGKNKHRGVFWLRPAQCISLSLSIASPENHSSGTIPLAAAASFCLPPPSSHCLLHRFLGFSSQPGPSQVPGSGGGGVAALAGAGASSPALLTLLSSSGSSYEMALSSFSSRQPPLQLQW